MIPSLLAKGENPPKGEWGEGSHDNDGQVVKPLQKAQQR